MYITKRVCHLLFLKHNVSTLVLFFLMTMLLLFIRLGACSMYSFFFAENVRYACVMPKRYTINFFAGLVQTFRLCLGIVQKLIKVLAFQLPYSFVCFHIGLQSVHIYSNWFTFALIVTFARLIVWWARLKKSSKWQASILTSPGPLCIFLYNSPYSLVPFKIDEFRVPFHTSPTVRPFNFCSISSVSTHSLPFP